MEVGVPDHLPNLGHGAEAPRRAGKRIDRSLGEVEGKLGVLLPAIGAFPGVRVRSVWIERDLESANEERSGPVHRRPVDAKAVNLGVNRLLDIVDYEPQRPHQFLLKSKPRSAVDG